MKILVTGKDGQLGKAFQTELGKFPQAEIRYLGRHDCDLADLDTLESILELFAPRIILNAAAYTAVDRAEQEEELAFAINADAPALMARYCANHGASFLHYSTDYVFDGSGSDFYLEDHPVNPLGIYGKSKAAGESGVTEAFLGVTNPHARYAIFRTSWVYGEGANFIRTILRLAKDRNELKVIVDQFGVPTSAQWLAALSIQFALQDFPSGIYHAVPQGETTWYGLACAVVQQAQLSGVNLLLERDHIRAIPATEYPLPAPRPMNSRMSTQKLQKALDNLGLVSKFPQWDELVRAYVSELAKKQLI